MERFGGNPNGPPPTVEQIKQLQVGVREGMRAVASLVSVSVTDGGRGLRLSSFLQAAGYSTILSTLVADRWLGDAWGG